MFHTNESNLDFPYPVLLGTKRVFRTLINSSNQIKHNYDLDPISYLLGDCKPGIESVRDTGLTM